MKKILSVLLVAVFVFSLGVNAFAAVSGEDGEQEHVYHVISEDDRYIVGRDNEGNIAVHDKTRVLSPMLRAKCSCNASTYDTTFRTHNGKSPTCTYTDETFRYCNNCGEGWSISKRTGTHAYSSSTCR